MSQLPATGSWSIYSMQKTLPELGQVGGVLGAHNYLALVDPNGNIVEEMHGVYSDHFTVGGGDSGNYLNVQMWKPNQYMADQTVTSSNAVMSGTQSSMQAAFDSAFNSTANALNATHDLYDGAELFGNSYNSNSVWCTAMHALGVSNPSAYSGPDATPGDETDLSTAPSNNPYVGTNNDPWVQNPSSNTIYYNQQGVGGNQDGSAEDPDNGFVVSDHDDNNLYAWSSMTAQFNANYGEVSSLIDYDNGTSEGDIFSPSNDISEIAVMYSGENSSGVQEQTTTTSTNGSTNVLITASGDIDNSNNATIDVDPGIQATINGNDNLINGATNASLTLEGAGNTATMAGGSGEMISVTDNGTGDVVSTGVCTNLTINGTNNNDTTAGVSNIWINGNGNTLTATQDGIAVGGTNNTVDLTGASTVWAQGSDNTVNADAGVTGVTAYGWGNYDTLDLGNSTTLTVVASNESDQVGNNSSVTISGSCDVIGAGSGASITASGYEDGVTVASNGTVSLNGASDTATATGTDSVVYANGTSDVVDLTGTSDIASLSSGDIGYGNGTSDWVTANGTNDVISLGGTLDLGTLGSGDTGYAFGNSDTLDANGTGSVISLQGTSDIAALSSSNTAYASGVSDVVNGNGGSDIVDLTGVSDIANLSASDTGYGNGTDDTVYANGANDIVSLAGSSDTGWLTSGDTGYGQSTATDDTFDASGTGITVAASSATVDLATNTQANLFGSSDNTVLSTGDTFGAYGGSNTITAVADTDVTVGETGGAFDTIIDNGDTQGQATADGGQSGIWPNANAALNLDGSSNSVFLATDDDLRAVGGGNTIYAGSDDNVTIANTGGAFDSVYVSGDTGGQATVDGTDTSGIYPGANTATNVYGSSNTINLATGDDLRATGGANTISAGADDNVTIAGTNGAYDSVYVSGDTGGQATVDGTDTSGIYPGAGTQVNLYGHSDTIDLATQDTLNVNGSRDVVNGSDDHVDLYGSYDDVYGNSDQVYATSGDDDFTSGSGDSDSGSGFDVGGVGGSSWSSYGLVAGATKAVKVVAQYDLSQGDTSAAASAIAGWNEAQQAIAAASDPDVSAPSSFESGSWAGSAVTWSFATGTGTDAAPLSGSIEAQYQGAIEQALQTWANVTGLTFQQVSDSPSADIRIGWGSFDTNDSGVIGLTSYSASDGAMQAGVIIRLEDPAEDSLVGNTDGSFAYSGTDVGLYQLALHEIGHALGLAESSDPNSVMFPELGAANTTLDGTDIADIQALYDPSNPSGNSSTALLAQAIASCSAPTSSTAVSLPITPAVPTMTLAAATAG